MGGTRFSRVTLGNRGPLGLPPWPKGGLKVSALFSGFIKCQLFKGARNISAIIKSQSQKMFHGGQVFFSDQNLVVSTHTETSLENLKNSFRVFIHEFEKEGIRIYQTQLTANANEDKRFIHVRLADMKAFDEQIYEKFISNPLEGITAIEDATTQYAMENERNHGSNDRWQVMITTDQNPKKLREIGSSLVSKLFSVQGIIVTTTKPFLKASVLKIQCKSCGHTKDLFLAPGQSPYIPRKCAGSTDSNKCELDSYMVLPTSEVIDAQNMKIQELPEEVPTGETPRARTMFADRLNVGKCVPGDKVRITGIMMTFDLKNSHENLSSGYIYVTGIEKLT